MIVVEDFDVAASSTRCYHWLEIRYNLIGQPSKKNCGQKIFKKKISSNEFGNPELMMLKYDTETFKKAWPGRGFKIIATAIDVSNSTGCGSPPVVPNSSNNHDKVGSKIGAIVIYKCDYSYHRRGIGSHVTCEADGTWSEVQFNCSSEGKLFECDFENGTCDIKFVNDGNYNWTVKTENGSSFLTVLPSTNTSKQITTTLTIPPHVYNNQSYCLWFRFKRATDAFGCANFGWGNTINRMVWKYNECGKKDWEIIKGTFQMWESITQVTLTFIANGTVFNGYIDDIYLYEGVC